MIDDESGMTEKVKGEILDFLDQELDELGEHEDPHNKAYFLCVLLAASGIECSEEQILDYLPKLHINIELFMQYASIFNGMQMLSVPESIGGIPVNKECKIAGELSKKNIDSGYIKIVHQVNSLHMDFIDS